MCRATAPPTPRGGSPWSVPLPSEEPEVTTQWGGKPHTRRLAKRPVPGPPLDTRAKAAAWPHVGGRGRLARMGRTASLRDTT